MAHASSNEHANAQLSKSPIAVITGSSGGIGRAAAIAFAQRGWRVALLARGLEGLEATERDVKRVGGEALVIPTDVADFAQMEAAAEQVEREWGPIDVWVNNAMATIFCEFMQIAPEDFKRATDVTYLGAVWGTHAALKRMKARNRGCIVQVGSALCYRSIPLQAPYCGAKSALRGFTDSIRSELIYERSKVHLVMVHLSAFNTPQFDWGRTCMTKKPKPVGKIFQPEIAAEGIYWAATHRRRELWVGWPAVLAILGTRVLPAYLDRKLAFDAYPGQQSEEPIEDERQDNLYRPVREDRGAHGRFDQKALRFSMQFWLTTHKWSMTLAGLVGLVALAVAIELSGLFR